MAEKGTAKTTTYTCMYYICAIELNYSYIMNCIQKQMMICCFGFKR